MVDAARLAVPRPPARPGLLAWQRLRVTLLASVPFGLLMSIGSETPVWMWLVRTATVGLGSMLAFGLLETWPARLPRWLARWVLQLLGVVVAVPIGALLVYWVTTGGNPNFAQEDRRVAGLLGLCFAGVLFGPWVALGALVRQRDAMAREQALGFELERSELERKALDARLRLLQAQVQPHFLFNTLANVRALVAAGSPQAPAVLDNLIAYLRAAVPRLDEPATTLGQELELVRAYLALMHLRMPDRLQYTLHADEAALSLQCPPMSLLTLVENAVRHGIDPSEVGGRIEVTAQALGARCLVRVIDSGMGLQSSGGGLGTGLSTLRERLQLAFGGDATLRVTSLVPHGVCAEMEFPAQAAMPMPTSTSTTQERMP